MTSAIPGLLFVFLVSLAVNVGYCWRAGYHTRNRLGDTPRIDSVCRANLFTLGLSAGGAVARIAFSRLTGMSPGNQHLVRVCRGILGASCLLGPAALVSGYAAEVGQWSGVPALVSRLLWFLLGLGTLVVFAGTAVHEDIRQQASVALKCAGQWVATVCGAVGLMFWLLSPPMSPAIVPVAFAAAAAVLVTSLRFGIQAMSTFLCLAVLVHEETESSDTPTGMKDALFGLGWATVLGVIAGLAVLIG